MYGKADEWAAARDQIREAVLDRGWSEKRQAYAQSFDSDELDAAQLLMPMVGFLPATDPRMRSTIEAIARDLTEDGSCSGIATARASTPTGSRARRARS